MAHNDTIVRTAESADVEGIVAIYNDVLASSTTIWSEHPVTVPERQRWLEEKREAGYPVLVATDETGVLGFVAAGAFRPWPGYDSTSEHSIHVRSDSRGRGIGTRLLSELERELERRGFHAMVAGVDAENLGSIRFHARCGFIEVARMPQVGRLRGSWRDLVLLLKHIDR